MSLEWKTQMGGIEQILYDTENGKIIGRVTKMGESYYAFYNSAVLGEYTTLEFAKSAIQNPPLPTFKEPEQTYRI
jgi:hypothetical protein